MPVRHQGTPNLLPTFIRYLSAVIAVFVVLGAAGWVVRSVREQPPIPQTQINREELFREGSLKFRSWNGVKVGHDIDTFLTLHPDGRADLEYWSDDLDWMAGTFSLDGDLVAIEGDFSRLAGLPGKSDWPILRLSRDGNDWLLSPAQSTRALKYERPRWIWWLELPKDDSAWPLRQIGVTKLPLTQ